MTRSENKNEASRGRGRRFFRLENFPLCLEGRGQRNLLLFALALMLTIIIVPKGGFIPDYYSPGDIASRDIKAPRDLLIPDLPLTEKKRQEAEAEVLPFYDFDPTAAREIANRLLQTIRQNYNSEIWTAPASEEVSQDLELVPGVVVGSLQLAALNEILSVGDTEDRVRQVVVQSLDRKTVANLQLFQVDRERGIVVRNLKDQSEQRVADLAEVIGLEDAAAAVETSLSHLDALGEQERKILFAVAQKLLRPNLTFNKNETEARKRQAREMVKPVLFQVKKGEMIVREGERVTADQIKKLKALTDVGKDYSSLSIAVGLLLCLLTVVFCTHRFARRNIRKYHPKNRDLCFLVVTFFGLLVLVKVAIFMSTALESAFPYIDSSSYYYVFPFAVGAMLVRIVLNSEVAFVFALLSSLVMGILFSGSLHLTFFALIGSLVGAHWVRQCKERATLYRAGLRLSLVNIVLIVAIHLMVGRALDVQLLYKIGFGFFNGLFCAVIVTGTVPMVEYLFRYTTDIKLLELANMNTPVLRELMVQAPGTYHHSIIVGNLVEAAAEAINANPLLARVAAYYHDIGKIKKPLYFVENLGSAENKHDKLAPSMSALILMSHVKDGVELARESKLGEILLEIIRQHHGTCLIKFFYDKAKSKEDPDVQQVDERDYRYPGPKPQTREAALIMLADAVEAASRTLTDPTPARIQGLVQKIINNIFIDGQLDECELTLKDLHNIAKSFNRILSGIFHHRIDYPEPAFKERDKEGVKRKNGEDSSREQTKEPRDKEPEPSKGSTDDLKRLGMS